MFSHLKQHNIVTMSNLTSTNSISSLYTNSDSELQGSFCNYLAQPKVTPLILS